MLAVTWWVREARSKAGVAHGAPVTLGRTITQLHLGLRLEPLWYL